MKKRPASEHRGWIGSLRYRVMERTSVRTGVPPLHGALFRELTGSALV